MSNETKERVKAIVTIIVTAAVNIANILGYATDQDALLNAALTIVSAICIVWSWWKNQNITVEAQKAQELLDRLKADRKAVKNG